MDELLAKAGSQVVTFAIRSGISLASGYAIKTVSSFLSKLPEEEKRSLERIKSRLQTKILIVTPAIDLIQLISARGNTSLESTVNLTKGLKHDISQFEQKILTINDEIKDASNKSSKLTKEDNKKRVNAANEVEEYMKDLLSRIEEAIPLISLALTTSGVNLSSSLSDSVSPGRLLQASAHLQKGDALFEANSSERHQVGPTFKLVLYSIFYGSSRNPYLSTADDITWREDYARCNVSLWRIPSKTKHAFYNYELNIEEDFNDGRYHDDDEKPKLRVINVNAVTKLFFSAAGKLLDIEESKSPVLVLKLNQLFESYKVAMKVNERPDSTYGDSEDETPEGNLSKKLQEEVSELQESNTASNIEWLALEECSEVEDEDEDSNVRTESENEDDELTENVSSLTSAMAKVSLKKSAKVSDKMASLSLLEYLIRLSALQSNDQESILNISDERISLYLRDENSSISKNQSRQQEKIRYSDEAGPRKLSSVARLSDNASLNTKKSTESTDDARESNPLTPWEQDRVLRKAKLKASREL